MTLNAWVRAGSIAVLSSSLSLSAWAQTPAPEPPPPEPAPLPAPPPPAAYPPAYPPYYPPPGYGVMTSSRPAAYRYEKRPNIALVATGAGVFGGFYLLSVIGGAAADFRNQSGWLAVPLVGPWVTMGRRDWERSCGTETLCFRDEAKGFMGFFLVFSGLAQAAGVATFIAGFAATTTEAVPVAIVPTPLPGGAGVSLTSRF